MLIHVERKRALLLAVGLLCLSQVAAASESRKVVGLVRSFRASAGGIAIPSEGTILTGDVLRTTKGGGATVVLSQTTRAVLAEETSVQFESLGDRVIAQISSGEMIVETDGNDFPFAETPKYVVQPVGAGKSVYLVAVLPDDGAVVTAHAGKISITEIGGSGRTVTLPEGQYAAMTAPASGASRQLRSPSQGKQLAGKLAPAADSTSATWHIAQLPTGSTPTSPMISEISNAHSGLKDRAEGRDRDRGCDDDDRDCRHRKSHHRRHHRKCDEGDWDCRRDQD